MSLVFCAIMPHPPILIPEIGGSRIKDVEKTKNSLVSIAEKMSKLKPQTTIVITPHGKYATDKIPVYTSSYFHGNFISFGFSEPHFSFKGNPSLAKMIIKGAKKENISAVSCDETFLDHGVLVPLYYPYIEKAIQSILPISIALLSLRELYEFGKVITKAIEEKGEKVCIIGSADLSHRLTPDAPAGYDIRGKEFDEKLVEMIEKMDVEGILNFDPALAEYAGQDALWSIAILLGSLSSFNFEHKVLSYEGPFGVGYLVAQFDIKQ